MLFCLLPWLSRWAPTSLGRYVNLLRTATIRQRPEFSRKYENTRQKRAIWRISLDIRAEQIDAYPKIASLLPLTSEVRNIDCMQGWAMGMPDYDPFPINQSINIRLLRVDPSSRLICGALCPRSCDISLLVKSTNNKRKCWKNKKKEKNTKNESYTEINNYKNEISIGE